MSISETKNLILRTVVETGVFISSEQAKDDVDLTDYLTNDSLVVSFFVLLEDSLCTILPEGWRGIENLKSLNAFAEKLNQIY